MRYCRENWWRRQANSVALILLSRWHCCRPGPDLPGLGRSNRYLARSVDAPLAGSARDAAVGIEPMAPDALGEGRGKGVGVRSSLGGL